MLDRIVARLYPNIQRKRILSLTCSHDFDMVPDEVHIGEFRLGSANSQNFHYSFIQHGNATAMKRSAIKSFGALLHSKYI